MAPAAAFSDSEADPAAPTALARSPDPSVRQKLAARTDLQPELLYFLAGDSEPAVRQTIAANPTTPRQADVLLANDQHEEVRSHLGQKIARLVPDLPPDQIGRLERLTLEILRTLARDQASRVRQHLAEALKDLAHAPQDVINRLARDVELCVAGPVLESSPVLTDADLLAIIGETHAEGALSAIARRFQVSGPVCAAIVASPDSAAIASLLGNPSAQIREETLDRILDQAPVHLSWHDPLVRRPWLPAAAVRRLTHFIADSLLHVLQSRQDLDPETAQDVALAVRRRLDQSGSAPPDPDWRPAPRPAGAEPLNLAPDDPAMESPMLRAQRLHAAGELDEDCLDDALMADDRAFVLAALEIRTQLPPLAVREIAESQSGRAVAALAWKAGLTPRFSLKLQIRLARIAPDKALRPLENGDWPVSLADLRWQLGCFSP